MPKMSEMHHLSCVHRVSRRDLRHDVFSVFAIRAKNQTHDNT